MTFKRGDAVWVDASEIDCAAPWLKMVIAKPHKDVAKAYWLTCGWYVHEADIRPRDPALHGADRPDAKEKL